MPIISFILVVCVIGFVLWLATTYIPMPDVVKKVLIGIVVVLVVLWFIQMLGFSTFNLGPPVGPIYHR